MGFRSLPVGSSAPEGRGWLWGTFPWAVSRHTPPDGTDNHSGGSPTACSILSWRLLEVRFLNGDSRLCVAHFPKSFRSP